MYVIALLALIFVVIFFAALGNSIGSALYFIDVPSLLIIVLITVPMLLASGLFSDLVRAFKVIMKKQIPYSKLELQKSLEAVRLTMKLIILSGIFGLLIGFMLILRFLNDTAALGPNLSVSVITLLYAVFGSLILLPIQSKLKVLILSKSKEE